MTDTGSLTALAAEWRLAADDVLDVARVVAPLAADEVVGLEMAVVGRPPVKVPSEEVVDHRVDALLRRSDDLIAGIGEGADTIPVLLAGLEVGNVLLVSSQDQEEAFRTLGTDTDGGVSLAGPSLALDEFQAAVVGKNAPTPAPLPLPAQLTDKLDLLQSAGAEELVALGKEAVLQQVLGNMVTGAVSLGGKKVDQAFDWVKSQVNFIRRAAVRILKWVMDKFEKLVPKGIRDKVDKAVEFATGKLKDGVEPLVGTLFGRLLGRADAEEAWRRAVARGCDTTTATTMLETVISGHLKRISYVSIGRKAVASAGAVVAAVLPIAAPEVQVALGALAVALIGFVCWQLWDGFNDIERLVPAVA